MAKILILLLLVQQLNSQFIVLSYYEIRNKNVVRQNYEESCGAASIATILNLIDVKRYSENDILQKLKQNNIVNTNMISFMDIQRTLEILGYRSVGYQINRGIFNHFKIPIIVKIENDPRYPHFVVAMNYDGDYIKVFDPNFGEYISSKEQFYKLWDKSNNGGYALIVEPKIQFIFNQIDIKLNGKLIDN
ncbi:cysteine peptidase family C39 domain-containing protein [Campylobacter sp. CX2-8023-23]|uniref:C39 family peptidase n=1 Tax=Campylobacter TaxID=194 RepID=UPI002A919981|nr:cysteine peptidase family C39 domain-containing protein [Campylobacter lanienae]MDY6135536.1 cysteine peptidase family C39 domain-containing protein [Campylobacter lanienae]MEE3705016.1 cysteine peptidase family C39 domain-containing protein [Campylobacter sp. CX2-8023-23]MEE3777004.1 cysteine peptidase family C39 domain-containing protein [Campylobacter sp. CX2-4080-23]